MEEQCCGHVISPLQTSSPGDYMGDSITTTYTEKTVIMVKIKIKMVSMFFLFVINIKNIIDRTSPTARLRK